MRRPLPPELEEAVLRLYEAFAPEPVYAAVCCRRVSLARTPQTRCATCPSVPTPVLLTDLPALRAWVQGTVTPLVNEQPE
jgi:hypothetical protein